MYRRVLVLFLIAVALVAVACTPAAPPVSAQVPPAGGTTAPTRGADDALCAPLLLDADPGFGTHVVFRRLPNAADLEDLRFTTGVRQIVVALAEWPASYAEIQPLQQAILPAGSELVVLLQGWPPTREALGAWNLVSGGALRIIVVVDGPPADRALITEFNRMRSLDRVIAQMDNPDRRGFERLQRPLSFRVVRN